ncbi:hypothetical protein DBR39_00110 [Chryseobacterium sp. KBW03]|nr:hypothetical protein DBR39_00110 [Chryseobacterium sp. KBW03]
MKGKIYYRFIPILLGLIAFTYFYLYKIVFLNNNYFYKNNVESKIVKVYNYENKSLQFYYSNDYCITTTDTKNDTLMIGDSISKKANTAKFKVYRKNKEDKYKFYKSYNTK